MGKQAIAGVLMALGALIALAFVAACLLLYWQQRSMI